jgi:hypothetical protein
VIDHRGRIDLRKELPSDPDETLVDMKMMGLVAVYLYSSKVLHAGWYI